MGTTLARLQHLLSLGTLPNSGAVLDIGSSNLYSADLDGLNNFAARFGHKLDPALVEHLVTGSQYGHGIPNNEAFVGELLEAVGLKYLAFDVANGYRTQAFDLNSDSLASDLRGTFDAVINFGTTEHVINQLNSFEVIHDATKVGGYMVHQLPAVGFIDHGFFCYTPRFFFDLAGYNNYELIDFSYDGPADGADIYDIIRDYTPHFPGLKHALRGDGPRPQNYGLNVILRKTNNDPLQLPMETSTSVVTENALVAGRTTSKIGLISSELEKLPFADLTHYWCMRLARGISRRLRFRS
ncbi:MULTISPECIES: hypothetical protein [unclassified Bradyrhizobium]|uniref:hypothetical protein n=1 Tax=unclassified Bradyrhizobium TaxID=2631580 RepID=UPI0028EFC235|nr:MULTISPECIES: hypothetical protein [unclassified Bradyrhizobium]